MKVSKRLLKLFTLLLATHFNLASPNAEVDACIADFHHSGGGCLINPNANTIVYSPLIKSLCGDLIDEYGTYLPNDNLLLNARIFDLNRYIPFTSSMCQNPNTNGSNIIFELAGYLQTKGVDFTSTSLDDVQFFNVSILNQISIEVKSRYDHMFFFDSSLNNDFFQSASFHQISFNQDNLAQTSELTLIQALNGNFLKLGETTGSCLKLSDDDPIFFPIPENLNQTVDNLFAYVKLPCTRDSCQCTCERGEDETDVWYYFNKNQGCHIETDELVTLGCNDESNSCFDDDGNGFYWQVDCQTCEKSECTTHFNENSVDGQYCYGSGLYDNEASFCTDLGTAFESDSSDFTNLCDADSANCVSPHSCCVAFCLHSEEVSEDFCGVFEVDNVPTINWFSKKDACVKMCTDNESVINTANVLVIGDNFSILKNVDVLLTKQKCCTDKIDSECNQSDSTPVCGAIDLFSFCPDLNCVIECSLLECFETYKDNTSFCIYDDGDGTTNYHVDITEFCQQEYDTGVVALTLDESETDCCKKKCTDRTETCLASDYQVRVICDFACDENVEENLLDVCTVEDENCDFEWCCSGWCLINIFGRFRCDSGSVMEIDNVLDCMHFCTSSPSIPLTIPESELCPHNNESDCDDYCAAEYCIETISMDVENLCNNGELISLEDYCNNIDSSIILGDIRNSSNYAISCVDPNCGEYTLDDCVYQKCKEDYNTISYFCKENHEQVTVMDYCRDPDSFTLLRVNGEESARLTDSDCDTKKREDCLNDLLSYNLSENNFKAFCSEKVTTDYIESIDDFCNNYYDPNNMPTIKQCLINGTDLRACSSCDVFDCELELNQMKSNQSWSTERICLKSFFNKEFTSTPTSEEMNSFFFSDIVTYCFQYLEKNDDSNYGGIINDCLDSENDCLNQENCCFNACMNHTTLENYYCSKGLKDVALEDFCVKLCEANPIFKSDCDCEPDYDGCTPCDNYLIEIDCGDTECNCEEAGCLLQANQFLDENTTENFCINFENEKDYDFFSTSANFCSEDNIAKIQTFEDFQQIDDDGIIGYLNAKGCKDCNETTDDGCYTHLCFNVWMPKDACMLDNDLYILVSFFGQCDPGNKTKDDYLRCTDADNNIIDCPNCSIAACESATLAEVQAIDNTVADVTTDLGDKKLCVSETQAYSTVAAYCSDQFADLENNPILYCSADTALCTDCCMRSCLTSLVYEASLCFEGIYLFYSDENNICTFHCSNPEINIYEIKIGIDAFRNATENECEAAKCVKDKSRMTYCKSDSNYELATLEEACDLSVYPPEDNEICSNAYLPKCWDLTNFEFDEEMDLPCEDGYFIHYEINEGDTSGMQNCYTSTCEFLACLDLMSSETNVCGTNGINYGTGEEFCYDKYLNKDYEETPLDEVTFDDDNCGDGCGDESDLEKKCRIANCNMKGDNEQDQCTLFDAQGDYEYACVTNYCVQFANNPEKFLKLNSAPNEDNPYGLHVNNRSNLCGSAQDENPYCSFADCRKIQCIVEYGDFKEVPEKSVSTVCSLDDITYHYEPLSGHEFCSLHTFLDSTCTTDLFDLATVNHNLENCSPADSTCNCSYIDCLYRMNLVHGNHLICTLDGDGEPILKSATNYCSDEEGDITNYKLCRVIEDEGTDDIVERKGVCYEITADDGRDNVSTEESFNCLMTYCLKTPGPFEVHCRASPAALVYIENQYDYCKDKFDNDKVDSDYQIGEDTCNACVLENKKFCKFGDSAIEILEATDCGTVPYIPCENDDNEVVDCTNNMCMTKYCKSLFAEQDSHMHCFKTFSSDSTNYISDASFCSDHLNFNYLETLDDWTLTNFEIGCEEFLVIQNNENESVEIPNEDCIPEQLCDIALCKEANEGNSYCKKKLGYESNVENNTISFKWTDEDHDSYCESENKDDFIPCNDCNCNLLECENYNTCDYILECEDHVACPGQDCENACGESYPFPQEFCEQLLTDHTNNAITENTDHVSEECCVNYCIDKTVLMLAEFDSPQNFYNFALIKYPANPEGIRESCELTCGKRDGEDTCLADSDDCVELDDKEPTVIEEIDFNTECVKVVMGIFRECSPDRTTDQCLHFQKIYSYFNDDIKTRWACMANEPTQSASNEEICAALLAKSDDVFIDCKISPEDDDRFCDLTGCHIGNCLRTLKDSTHAFRRETGMLTVTEFCDLLSPQNNTEIYHCVDTVESQCTTKCIEACVALENEPGDFCPTAEPSSTKEEYCTIKCSGDDYDYPANCTDCSTSCCKDGFDAIYEETTQCRDVAVNNSFDISKEDYSTSQCNDDGLGFSDLIDGEGNCYFNGLMFSYDNADPPVTEFCLTSGEMVSSDNFNGSLDNIITCNNGEDSIIKCENCCFEACKHEYGIYFEEDHNLCDHSLLVYTSVGDFCNASCDDDIEPLEHDEFCEGDYCSSNDCFMKALIISTQKSLTCETEAKLLEFSPFFCEDGECKAFCIIEDEQYFTFENVVEFEGIHYLDTPPTSQPLHMDNVFVCPSPESCDSMCEMKMFIELQLPIHGCYEAINFEDQFIAYGDSQYILEKMSEFNIPEEGPPISELFQKRNCECSSFEDCCMSSCMDQEHDQFCCKGEHSDEYLHIFESKEEFCPHFCKHYKDPELKCLRVKNDNKFTCATIDQMNNDFGPQFCLLEEDNTSVVFGVSLTEENMSKAILCRDEFYQGKFKGCADENECNLYGCKDIALRSGDNFITGNEQGCLLDNETPLGIVYDLEKFCQNPGSSLQMCDGDCELEICDATCINAISQANSQGCVFSPDKNQFYLWESHDEYCASVDEHEFDYQLIFKPLKCQEIIGKDCENPTECAEVKCMMDQEHYCELKEESEMFQRKLDCKGGDPDPNEICEGGCEEMDCCMKTFEGRQVGEACYHGEMVEVEDLCEIFNGAEEEELEHLYQLAGVDGENCFLEFCCEQEEADLIDCVIEDCIKKCPEEREHAVFKINDEFIIEDICEMNCKGFNNWFSKAVPGEQDPRYVIKCDVECEIPIPIEEPICSSETGYTDNDLACNRANYEEHLDGSGEERIILNPGYPSTFLSDFDCGEGWDDCSKKCHREICFEECNMSTEEEVGQCSKNGIVKENMCGIKCNNLIHAASCHSLFEDNGFDPDERNFEACQQLCCDLREKDKKDICSSDGNIYSKCEIDFKELDMVQDLNVEDLGCDGNRHLRFAYECKSLFVMENPPR